MSIEERLARVEKILDARGLDWDHPKVDAGEKPEPPAKPKRWRRLDPKELVQDGDWMNAMRNRQDVNPPDGGWIPADSFYFGRKAGFFYAAIFAREVTDDANQCDQPADPPEPEYREPVLPGDAGKQCEFSDDGDFWTAGKLFAWMDTGGFPWRSTSGNHWRFARIRKDA